MGASRQAVFLQWSWCHIHPNLCHDGLFWNFVGLSEDLSHQIAKYDVLVGNINVQFSMCSGVAHLLFVFCNMRQA